MNSASQFENFPLLLHMTKMWIYSLINNGRTTANKVSKIPKYSDSLVSYEFMMRYTSITQNVASKLQITFIDVFQKTRRNMDIWIQLNLFKCWKKNHCAMKYIYWKLQGNLYRGIVSYNINIYIYIYNGAYWNPRIFFYLLFSSRNFIKTEAYTYIYVCIYVALYLYIYIYVLEKDVGNPVFHTS